MSPPPLQGAELQQQQQQLDLRLQQRCGPLPPPRPVADLQPASLRATTTTAGGTPAATPADPPPKAAPGSAALPAAARALIRAHGVASAKGSAADGERSASLLLEVRRIWPAHRFSPIPPLRPPRRAFLGWPTPPTPSYP